MCMCDTVRRRAARYRCGQWHPGNTLRRTAHKHAHTFQKVVEGRQPRRLWAPSECGTSTARTEYDSHTEPGLYVAKLTTECMREKPTEEWCACVCWGGGVRWWALWYTPKEAPVSRLQHRCPNQSGHASGHLHGHVKTEESTLSNACISVPAKNKHNLNNNTPPMVLYSPPSPTPTPTHHVQ